MSSTPASSNVGRFTGIVLGAVVFVCVAMIGATGYLKLKMDRAETTLAAPEHALSSDQDVFLRLRRDLGYGGFLGLAQAYVSTKDASGLSEMAADMKSADDILAHFPDKTPAETRHELTAIGNTFDAAWRKLDAAIGGTGEFAANDLAPLYAAMPVLDARVSAMDAIARMQAQNDVETWAMLLTLASWFSLIIAAACAAGIYLTLRDKYSAPMRALAQSIQNMSRGDMRTAIWGTERQDAIGELARAVDIARYHFSNLPDLTLLSEHGPIRLKFEGETRSLFESLMKAISIDSEKIRQQSEALSFAAIQQRASLSGITEKIETILKGMLERAQTGDQEIRRAIHDMLGSCEGLKNAHIHAADQLNRLIPHIHERATNMAEIAQVAGRQIGQTMQSLAASELGMKTNAEQAKDTLTKLASTADNLGERLFGAINLLQASGKVMAQTVEEVRNRYGDDQKPEVDLSPLAQRLEEIAGKLAALESHEPATVDLAPLSQRLEEIAGKLAAIEAHEPATFDLAPLSQQIENIAGKIGQQESEPGNVEQLIAAHIAPKFDAIAQSLAQNHVDSAVKINTALGELSHKLDTLSQTLPEELKHSLHEDFKNAAPDAAALGGKIDELQAGLEKTTALPHEMAEKMNDLWRQLAAQIEASRASLDKALHQDVSDKLAAFEQTLIDTRHAIEAARMEIAKPLQKPTLALPPELQQQMLDQWTQMASQIEASRSSLITAIADQLDKLETRLAGRGATAALSKTASDYATQKQIEQQTQILSELVATLGVIDRHMQQIKSEIHAAPIGNREF